MKQGEFEARLSAMATLGLLTDREVEVLLALRRNDVAVLSRVLAECLAVSMKIEAPKEAPKEARKPALRKRATTRRR